MTNIARDKSATNIPSACRIANIAFNDAMILSYDANPSRIEFSERTSDKPFGTHSRAAALSYDFNVISVAAVILYKIRWPSRRRGRHFRAVRCNLPVYDGHRPDADFSRASRHYPPTRGWPAQMRAEMAA